MKLEKCPVCGAELEEHEGAWTCGNCDFIELKKEVIVYLIEDKSYEDKPYYQKKIDDGKCVACFYVDWEDSEEELWDKIAQQTNMRVIGYSKLGAILEKGIDIYICYFTKKSNDYIHPNYVRIVRIYSPI